MKIVGDMKTIIGPEARSIEKIKAPTMAPCGTQKEYRISSY